MSIHYYIPISKPLGAELAGIQIGGIAIVPLVLVPDPLQLVHLILQCGHLGVQDLDRPIPFLHLPQVYFLWKGP